MFKCSIVSGVLQVFEGLGMLEVLGSVGGVVSARVVNGVQGCQGVFRMFGVLNLKSLNPKQSLPAP